MEIETLAVSEIQSMVARCTHLQPFIASNDKTPFTDGDIDVYDAPGRRKQDWIGRVSVQVKGRKTPRNSRNRKKFRIARTDLLGFERNGGVLYFVVSVDAVTGNSTPHYAILTPFKIEHLLAQVPKEQASVSVSLTRFPSATNEIERIVRLALMGRKQIPSLGVDSALFETMQSITVFSTSDLNLEAPVTLTPDDHDFVLEMTTAGGSTVPLGGVLQIMPPSYLEHEVESTIRGGQSTYERAAVRQIDAESFEATLADGLSLLMVNTEGQAKFSVNITLQSNFAERIKALEFFFGVADDGEIQVNGRVLARGYQLNDTELEQFSELREHLDFLLELRDLFSRLGVDYTHVDISSLDDSQFRNLRTLYLAFVRGDEIINENGKVGRGVFAVGQWALLILIMPGKAPGYWRLIDPFNPDTPKAFRLRAENAESGKSEPVTVYDIIEREQLPKFLNLQLDSVTAAYEALPNSDRTTELANLFVLDLIWAADECAPRKEEFLRGATLLNEWIIDKVGGQPIHLINKWQIDWRNEALTPGDRDSIRNLRRTTPRTQDNFAEIELACSLLLGETAEAEYLVGQLPEQQLQRMETWPIWRLRQPPDGATGDLLR